VKRLHLIDGTWELFRQHFSKRPSHRAPDGRDLKATVGVAGNLLGMLQSESDPVTHIAVAFDNPIESFRNRLWAGYKTSEGVPPELLAQFDEVEAAVTALGIAVWSMKEWECDDALCAGARRWRDDFDEVVICSPDKDLGQCVEDERIVQLDRLRDKRLDEAAILALRGIPPRAIPDWLALVGDTADGYPGLPGFGEKSATAVLAAFGSLEKIPDDAARWPKTVRGADKLAATLAARREEAMLFRKLATLVDDLPLPQSRAEELAWRGVPREAFEAWCARAGARSLLERVRRWRD